MSFANGDVISLAEKPVQRECEVGAFSRDHQGYRARHSFQIAESEQIRFDHRCDCLIVDHRHFEIATVDMEIGYLQVKVRGEHEVGQHDLRNTGKSVRTERNAVIQRAGMLAEIQRTHIPFYDVFVRDRLQSVIISAVGVLDVFQIVTHHPDGGNGDHGHGHETPK